MYSPFCIRRRPPQFRIQDFLISIEYLGQFGPKPIPQAFELLAQLKIIIYLAVVSHHDVVVERAERLVALGRRSMIARRTWARPTPSAPCQIPDASDPRWASCGAWPPIPALRRTSCRPDRKYLLFRTLMTATLSRFGADPSATLDRQSLVYHDR